MLFDRRQLPEGSIDFLGTESNYAIPEDFISALYPVGQWDPGGAE
jgi:hypothetical protein